MLNEGHRSNKQQQSAFGEQCNVHLKPGSTLEKKHTSLLLLFGLFIVRASNIVILR